MKKHRFLEKQDMKWETKKLKNFDFFEWPGNLFEKKYKRKIKIPTGK